MATAPVEAITDAEAFGSYLEKSETQLIVMDVHQNWCGPCDTMKPTYNSIFNEINDCENKVVFTTADKSVLNEVACKQCLHEVYFVQRAIVLFGQTNRNHTTSC